MALKNSFAQIKTGQGKSIILAGLSTYLGLIGYNVYCVCYSQYLSDRDKKLFENVYDKLGIR